MKFSIRTASRRHVTDRKRTREAARALHTELSEPGARVALGTRHSTPAPAPALPGRERRRTGRRGARGGGQSLTRPRLDVCQNVDRGSSVPTRRRLCMNDPTSQGSAPGRRGQAQRGCSRPLCEAELSAAVWTCEALAPSAARVQEALSRAGTRGTARPLGPRCRLGRAEEGVRRGLGSRPRGTSTGRPSPARATQAAGPTGLGFQRGQLDSETKTWPATDATHSRRRNPSRVGDQGGSRRQGGQARTAAARVTRDSDPWL